MSWLMENQRLIGRCAWVAAWVGRPGGPRPVRLTTAGEILLMHGRAVLARVSSAAADLRALASGEQGELRVGTLPSVGTKVLPDLLATFRADWPGIEIVLRESRGRRRTDPRRGVRRHRRHLLRHRTERHGAARGSPAARRPDGVPAPAGSLEAGWRVVSIADIAHLPMIGTRDPGCRQIIDDAFRQAPIPPTYVFRSENNPTIHGLVGSGLAYAVLPLRAADENYPNVAVIPIQPAPPPRRLGIAWHRECRQPPPLMPFVDAAADVCRDLGDRWAEAHGMSCAMESSNSSDRG